MFESALDGLLQKYLSPYLEDLNSDTLRIGIFSGVVELKRLRVRKNLFQLLGIDSLKLIDGEVATIKVTLPSLSQLTSAAIKFEIDGVKCSLRALHGGHEASLPEKVAALRQTRKDAINAREESLLQQYEDALQKKKQKEAAGGGSGGAEDDGGKPMGYFAKLGHKLLGNLVIEITNLSFTFIDTVRKVDMGADLPSLVVKSTDKNFQILPPGGSDNAAPPASLATLYKLMEINGLAVWFADRGERLTPRGRPRGAQAAHQQLQPQQQAADRDTSNNQPDSPLNKQYMLQPCRLALGLAHEPEVGMLRVLLDFSEAKETAGARIKERINPFPWSFVWCACSCGCAGEADVIRIPVKCRQKWVFHLFKRSNWLVERVAGTFAAGLFGGGRMSMNKNSIKARASSTAARSGTTDFNNYAGGGVSDQGEMTEDERRASSMLGLGGLSKKPNLQNGLAMTRSQFVAIMRMVERAERDEREVLNAMCPASVLAQFPNPHYSYGKEYMSLFATKLVRESDLPPSLQKIIAKMATQTLRAHGQMGMSSSQFEYGMSEIEAEVLDVAAGISGGRAKAGGSAPAAGAEGVSTTSKSAPSAVPAATSAGQKSAPAAAGTKDKENQTGTSAGAGSTASQEHDDGDSSEILDAEAVDARLALMEDVISTFYTAKWRAAIGNSVKKAKEILGKKEKAEADRKAAEKKKDTWWGWFTGTGKKTSSSPSTGAGAAGNFIKDGLSTDQLQKLEQEQLASEIFLNLDNEIANINEIEMPSRVVVGFQCSSFGIRITEDVPTQLSRRNPRLAMRNKDIIRAQFTNVCFMLGLSAKVDHTGLDTNELFVLVGMDGVDASHFGRPVIRTRRKQQRRTVRGAGGSTSPPTGSGAGGAGPGGPPGRNKSASPRAFYSPRGQQQQGDSSPRSPNLSDQDERVYDVWAADESPESTPRGTTPRGPVDRTKFSENKFAGRNLEQCMTNAWNDRDSDIQSFREDLKRRNRSQGQFVLFNKKADTQKVMGISYESIPLGVFLRPMIVPSIVAYFDVTAEVEEVLGPRPVYNKTASAPSAPGAPSSVQLPPSASVSRGGQQTLESIDEVAMARMMSPPVSLSSATSTGAATTTTTYGGHQQRVLQRQPSLNTTAQVVEQRLEALDYYLDFASAAYADNKSQLEKHIVPDAIDLYFSFKSPTVEFATDTRASASFKLGNLLFFSTLPFGMEKASFQAFLNDTSLKVTTSLKERLYVLKPVPMLADIQTDMAWTHFVSVQVARCELHLSPQALTILLALPQMITAAVVDGGGGAAITGGSSEEGAPRGAGETKNQGEPAPAGGPHQQNKQPHRLQRVDSRTTVTPLLARQNSLSSQNKLVGTNKFWGDVVYTKVRDKWNAMPDSSASTNTTTTGSPPLKSVSSKPLRVHRAASVTFTLDELESGRDPDLRKKRDQGMIAGEVGDLEDRDLLSGTTSRPTVDVEQLDHAQSTGGATTTTAGGATTTTATAAGTMNPNAPAPGGSRSKSMNVMVAVGIERVLITLGDTVIPVLQLQARLPDLLYHARGNDYSVQAEKGMFLDMMLYNTRNGSWEPLLEPFCFNEVSLKVDDAARKMLFTLSGTSRPFLLNFSPTSVAKLSWFVPWFTSELSASGDMLGNVDYMAGPDAGLWTSDYDSVRGSSRMVEMGQTRMYSPSMMTRRLEGDAEPPEKTPLEIQSGEDGEGFSSAVSEIQVSSGMSTSNISSGRGGAAGGEKNGSSTRSFHSAASSLGDNSSLEMKNGRAKNTSSGDVLPRAVKFAMPSENEKAAVPAMNYMGTAVAGSRANPTEAELRLGFITSQRAARQPADVRSPYHELDDALTSWKHSRFRCVNLLPFTCGVRFFPSEENAGDHEGSDPAASATGAGRETVAPRKLMTTMSPRGGGGARGAVPRGSNNNSLSSGAPPSPRGNATGASSSTATARTTGTTVVRSSGEQQLIDRLPPRLPNEADCLLISPLQGPRDWAALDSGILPTLAESLDVRLVMLSEKDGKSLPTVGGGSSRRWKNNLDVGAGVGVASTVVNPRQGAVSTTTASTTSTDPAPVPHPTSTTVANSKQAAVAAAAVARRQRLLVYQAGCLQFAQSTDLRQIQYIARMVAPNSSHKVLVLSTSVTLHNHLAVPCRVKMDNLNPNLNALASKCAFLDEAAAKEYATYPRRCFYEKHVQMDLQRQLEKAPEKKYLNPEEYMSVIRVFDFAWSPVVDLARKLGKRESKWCLEIFNLQKQSKDAGVNEQSPSFNVVLAAETVQSGPPMNKPIREVHLLPALTFENALPCRLALVIEEVRPMDDLQGAAGGSSGDRGAGGGVAASSATSNRSDGGAPGADGQSSRPVKRKRVRVETIVEPLSVWHSFEVDPRSFIQLHVRVYEGDDASSTQSQNKRPNPKVKLPVFSPYYEESLRRHQLGALQRQNKVGGPTAKGSPYKTGAQKKVGLSAKEEDTNKHVEIALYHGSHRPFQAVCKLGLKTKIFCPIWMVNRTQENKLPIDLFPSFSGQTLLGNVIQDVEQEDEMGEHRQKMAHVVQIAGRRVELPVEYCMLDRGVNLCVQAHTFTVMATLCQMFHLLPRLIFHNKSSNTTFEILQVPFAELPAKLQEQERTRVQQQVLEDENLSEEACLVTERKTFKLAPGQMVVPSQDLVAVRFRVQGMSRWSALVITADDQAGDFPFVLEGDIIATVEVCPDRGRLGINFRTGSSYTIENDTFDYVCHVNSSIIADAKINLDQMLALGGGNNYEQGADHFDQERMLLEMADMGDDFVDDPPTVTEYGWADPFFEEALREQNPAANNAGERERRNRREREQIARAAGAGATSANPDADSRQMKLPRTLSATALTGAADNAMENSSNAAGATSDPNLSARWLVEIDIRAKEDNALVDRIALYAYEAATYHIKPIDLGPLLNKRVVASRKDHVTGRKRAGTTASSPNSKSPRRVSDPLIVTVTRSGAANVIRLEKEDRELQLAKRRELHSFEAKLNLNRVGLSFISEKRQEEFLYMQLDLVRSVFLQEKDKMTVQLVVSDMQADCQFQSRKRTPLLHAQMQQQQTRTLLWDSLDTKLPVVMGNRGSSTGTVPFLEVLLTRTAIASRDTVIPVLEIAVDELELNMDDEILLGFQEYINIDFAAAYAGVGEEDDEDLLEEDLDDGARGGGARQGERTGVTIAGAAGGGKGKWAALGKMMLPTAAGAAKPVREEWEALYSPWWTAAGKNAAKKNLLGRQLSMEKTGAAGATGVPLTRVLSEDGSDGAKISLEAKLDAGTMLTLDELRQFALTALIEDPGYKIPDVPPVLQIDRLRISKIRLLVWVELLLDNMEFLPESVKTFIRVLSLGSTFTVERGELVLDAIGGRPQHLATTNVYSRGRGDKNRRNNNAGTGRPAAIPEDDEVELSEREEEEPFVSITPFRGSMPLFVNGLIGEYSRNLFLTVMKVLGKSGTVVLARSPIQFFQKTGTFFVDTFGGLFSDGAHIFSYLTFDADYVREQKKVRDLKKREIDGVLSGATEALKSLGDGAIGLFDIVTKPIEGATTDGVTGFFTGLGQGFMGTLVKPVSKFGDAIADLGQGVSAEFQTTKDSNRRKAGFARTLIEPKRLPRFLSGPLGCVEWYNSFEARVLHHCHLYARHADLLIPIGIEHSVGENSLGQDAEDVDYGPAMYVLIAHADRISFARVPLRLESHKTKSTLNADGTVASSSSSPERRAEDEEEDDDVNVLSALAAAGHNVLNAALVPAATVGGLVQKTADLIYDAEDDAYDMDKVAPAVRQRVRWQCALENICEVRTSKGVISLFQYNTSEDPRSDVVPEKLPALNWIRAEFLRMKGLKIETILFYWQESRVGEQLARSNYARFRRAREKALLELNNDWETQSTVTLYTTNSGGPTPTPGVWGSGVVSSGGGAGAAAANLSPRDPNELGEPPSGESDRHQFVVSSGSGMSSANMSMAGQLSSLESDQFQLSSQPAGSSAAPGTRRPSAAGRGRRVAFGEGEAAHPPAASPSSSSSSKSSARSNTDSDALPQRLEIVDRAADSSSTSSFRPPVRAGRGSAAEGVGGRDMEDMLAVSGISNLTIPASSAGGGPPPTSSSRPQPAATGSPNQTMERRAAARGDGPSPRAAALLSAEPPDHTIMRELLKVLRGEARDWKRVKDALTMFGRARLYLDLLLPKGKSLLLNANDDSTNVRTRRLVECYEVERNKVFEWGPAYFPTDGDSRWKWLNMNMEKHPFIDPSLSRGQCQRARKPPFVFSKLWKPKGPWKIVKDVETTGAGGWVYAVNWSNKNWTKTEGIMDYVRRRKWVREFE